MFLKRLIFEKCSRDVDSSQCLEEIKEYIKDTYECFDVADSVWWVSFFMEQSDIISNSTNGDIYLKSPFTWPHRVTNKNEETNVEPQGVKFSQVEEIEMYIGSRISSSKHREIKYLYRGIVQDIEEGCMNAVLGTDDAHDYSLWIAKFTKVNK